MTEENTITTRTNVCRLLHNDILEVVNKLNETLFEEDNLPRARQIFQRLS